MRDGTTDELMDVITDKRTDQVIRGGMRGVIARVTALLETVMKSLIPAPMMMMNGSQFLAGSLKAGLTKLIIISLQVP